MNLVIDASVWVSAAVREEESSLLSLAFIQRKHLVSGNVFCPSIVLAECASAIIRPVREEHKADAVRLAKELLSRIKQYPNMRLIAVDEVMADQAVKLVQEAALRGADSIYAALAKMEDATLVSWDKVFFSEKAMKTVKALTPEQWLEANA